MKKSMINTLGVTLLEILLVLAIAAMVIIMSVRYYQSSNVSQQTNAAIEEIQAIASAMDNVASGNNNSYTGITSAQLKTVVGSSNMISPVGAPVGYTGASSGTTYSISMPLTPAVCANVLTKLTANTKLTAVCDATTGVLTYTYDNAN